MGKGSVAETAKDTVYTHLKVPSPGPGYCHFPKRSEYDEEYFKQLFAEEPKYRIRNGRRVCLYVTRHKRNETVDLRVMNWVALELADLRSVVINGESDHRTRPIIRGDVLFRLEWKSDRSDVTICSDLNRFPAILNSFLARKLTGELDQVNGGRPSPSC